ncbi:Protein RNA-directed DNA methylation 3 [Psilocybe cubensis]|uniref:Protein RNA-directed DNA methylation 3 n=1 Tax=Psilocybe cubensis TaxID=181762 RepID=A0ACB8H544_PSICU|nr:Protein RNA-directed DNA methylation 3 [Psilocybe cubensis]KAH9482893.1 Protein RNA-directed DNA methylation 3 [Psilocybe cubensis]
MKRRSNVRKNVAQFLDVEAGVDDGEEADSGEEESEQELDNEFLDEQEVDGVDVHPRSLDEYAQMNDEALEALLLRSKERSLAESNRRKSNCVDAADDIFSPSFLPVLTEADFPLWKVTCRVGREELAIASLLLNAQDKHKIRSAFSVERMKGCIFLETLWNPNTVDLLKKTPGVLVTKRGVQQSLVLPDDYREILRGQGKISPPKRGSWVTVSKGRLVRLLMLPRLPLPGASRVTKRRKTDHSGDSVLWSKTQWTEWLNSQGRSHQVVEHTEHCWQIGNTLFEHGLMIQDIGQDSIDVVVEEMPFRYFRLFQQSTHSSLDSSYMLRPTEWKFEPGEAILAASIEGSQSREASVVAIHPYYLEVAYTTHDSHNIADTSLSGENQGVEGWLIAKTNEAVVIGLFDSDLLTIPSLQVLDNIQTIEAPINWVHVSKAPFQHRMKENKKKKVEIPSEARHFWCDTEVLISKQHHPMKTRRGKVVDVSPSADSIQNMRVLVELLDYHAACPFQKILLNYGDVVDARTLLPLGDRHAFDGMPTLLNNPDRSVDTLSQSAERSGTPIPTSPIADGQWDPSAPLPHNPQSSMSPSEYSHPSHVLFKEMLVGQKVAVYIKGGSFKDSKRHYFVTIARDERNHFTLLLLRQKRPSMTLQPEWVTPKHPSGTHTNDLLFVVDGENQHQFVRRIAQRDLVNQSPILLVNPVMRREGQSDILCGVPFEVESTATIPPPGPSAAARQILNDIKKDDLIVSCIKALEISFDLSRLAPRRSRAYILVMVLISTFLLAVSEVAERSEGRRYTLESFNFLQRATREARQAVAMDVAQHCDQTRVDVPTPESNTFPVLSNRNDSHFQYQLLNLAMTCDTVFGLTRAANALHNLLLENSGILEERIITCSRSMVEEAAEFADNDVFELATILAAIPSVNFHLNMDLIQDAARAVYVAAGLRRDLDEALKICSLALTKKE